MRSRIAVKVTPRAARDRIVGWRDGALVVRLHAAPEHGRANAALEALLARELGLAKRAVSVAAGHAGRRKLVDIEGLDWPALERRLAERARVER